MSDMVVSYTLPDELLEHADTIAEIAQQVGAQVAERWRVNMQEALELLDAPPHIVAMLDPVPKLRLVVNNDDT